MAAYKVDVQHSALENRYGDRYVVFVRDKDTDEARIRFSFVGTKTEALVAGMRIADAYEQGFKDGEQKTLNRVLDMVQQWGGEKQ